MRTTPAVLLIFLSSLFLVACNSPKNESRYAFDTGSMLANYADNIIIPQYKAFAEDTAELQKRVAAYRESPDTALAPAQYQWRTAAINWQKIELFLVGPIAENEFALRDRINVYSDNQRTNACQLDQTTLALAENADAVNIDDLSVNQTGLGGLEYLLINQSTAFACTNASDQELQRWQNIDVVATRALLAENIAKQLAATAQNLYQTWQTDGGNFRAHFINPANGGEYIQALSDALFFLDKNVKDTKLSLPLGISARCAFDACPKLVEYPYSQQSLSMIKSNLEAFKAAFNGGEGFGFANIIVEKEQKPLADRFNNNIDAALTLINQINGSLYAQAELILQDNDEDNAACNNAVANPEISSKLPACQLYGLIKRITDDLKTGFVAVVDLDIPKRAQSDND